MDQEILKVFFYVSPLPASIPELKVRIRTAIETITAVMLQTNSIFVFMFVESQRVHIYSTCKVCHKNLDCCSIK